MPNEPEKLWDYDAVAIGQTGTETTVTITLDTLREYARATQHARGSELDQINDAPHPAAVLAMPSMALAYAPLLRYDLAENNGFVALEDSKTARRQTPFAKCDIRWHAPVAVGDCITATRRVLDKYERRGSKFVTFRVEAVNQHGGHGRRLRLHLYLRLCPGAEDRTRLRRSRDGGDDGQARAACGRSASGPDGRARHGGHRATGAPGYGEPGHDSGL